ncbi:hypothetical protein KP509_14G011700 [Ceratopteris richardii]|nr:hypothetical protein KP509_14G011700 [Ceratopteris richardii]
MPVSSFITSVSSPVPQSVIHTADHVLQADQTSSIHTIEVSLSEEGHVQRRLLKSTRSHCPVECKAADSSESSETLEKDKNSVMRRTVDSTLFISRADGRKRARSSAIRDYPEGCCNGVSLIDKPVLAEEAHLYSSGMKTQAGGLSSKPGNTLVPPAKRQSTHSFLPERPENKVPKLHSLKAVQKTGKVTQGRVAYSLPSSSPCEVSKVLALPNLHSHDHGVQASSQQERSKPVQWPPEELYHYREDDVRSGRCVNYCSSLKLSKRSVESVSALATYFNNKGTDKPLLLSGTSSGTNARSCVKRTLQEFDCVRRILAMSKDGHQRPDLAAAKILKKKGRWRNCDGERIVGSVPGVEVGDQFSFRIEMLMVGLHRQPQGGIDYISKSVRTEGPLATSIVASGGYEDDDDHGATFIYTGQGGNNYKGDRRQASNQVLARGNLALRNSFKERTPVRVIRGYPNDKLYTYDGLYDVIDCWFQTGIAGFGVYQFKLSRRPGQPELISSVVRFIGGVKKRSLTRSHILLADLSRGTERLPVSVVNGEGNTMLPDAFTYIANMKYPIWCCPKPSKGCDCVNGCIDVSKCLCAAKNGGEFPYNEVGQIVRGKKLVFECGETCSCPPSCYNRVNQQGLKHQLEVFKTKDKGWGVRSLEPIRPGDIICEYVGELLSDSDAEQRVDCDSYLFDIGHRSDSYVDVADLMNISSGNSIGPVIEDTCFAIDARLCGNVARFINHSCAPNLFPQNVVYGTDDLRFPHVVLFAMENIPPMRELSYDYNYTIDHVRDVNGNIKCKQCFCGAQNCRGRLY